MKRSPNEVILEIGPDGRAGCRQTNKIKESETQAPFTFNSGSNKDLLFPVDEVGAPLPIYVPTDEMHGMTNRHHHFATRRRFNNELGDIGKALRASRIQKVPVRLHGMFNDLKYTDTPVPNDMTSRFGLLLLMTAGYLPERAINVRGDTLRTLEYAERDHIWSNNLIRLDSMNTVHKFIREYIVQKGMRQFTEDDVDEFLHSRDPSKVRDIGKGLVSAVADISTDPVKEVYIDAWKSGLLPRNDYRSEKDNKYKVKAVPKKPARFILKHVLDVDIFIPNIRKELSKKFAVGLTSVS